MRSLAILHAIAAALLLPALLLGSLDLHTSDLPHGVFVGTGVVLADAQHPLQPEHLEASIAVRIPPCPACLLQLKTSGGAVEPPALEPEPVVLEPSIAAVVDVPLATPSYGLRSRAPPFA